MKKAFVFVLLCCVCAAAYAAGERKPMKIKMTFPGGEAIIALRDNTASVRLLQMLPADFTFRDFAGEEKITDFPRPLDLQGAPRGMVAKAGRLFIYAPWGNMGIFYKNHGTKEDKNLIWLGEVQSGLEALALQKENFRARLEIIN